MKLKLLFASISCLFALSLAFAQTPKPGSPLANQFAIEKELGWKGPWGEPGAPKRNQPVNISVNCNLPRGSNNTISGAIANLAPLGAWVLNVSGACKDNVVIQSFENISIVAQPGASITDASGGNLDVIDVFDTHYCADFSLCRFSGNTIQSAAGPGVVVRRSKASFQGDVIQNNGGRGLNILSAGTAALVGVTIQNNVAAGAAAFFGSSLIAANLVSQNNGGFGGIRISDHSSLRLIDSTLTANLGSGVWLDSSSEAEFEDSATFNLISGNGGSGVALGDLCFANFQGADQITGNNLGNPGAVDVHCGPQFSATRGALANIGGGKTNCTEP
jgi:Right handed beta helix region